METKEIIKAIDETCKECQVCDPCCTGNLIKRCINKR